MAKTVDLIDLENSSEEFVSTLGGKKNEPIPMEVLDIDVENDAIDDILYKVSDFDVIKKQDSSILKFKNRVELISIDKHGTIYNIASDNEWMSTIDELFQSDSKLEDADWSFYNVDFDIIKEAIYMFRMILSLYGYVKGFVKIAEDLINYHPKMDFFKYFICFRDDDQFITDQIGELYFPEQKEYVREKVPKYCMRYQTGKRKGQAYWRYGWGTLIGIDINFVATPIASNNHRVVIARCRDFIEHAFVFIASDQIIEYVKKTMNSNDKDYFPLWFKFQVSGEWAVYRKLDKVHFYNLKITFMGSLKDYHGGSSEEDIIC